MMDLSIVCFILSAFSCILSVYLTKYDAENNGSQEFQTQEQKCDDIAIIGAGIGGSYIAWRLRHRNLSVNVYEYSDRVGGRMHTVRFRDIPDINVELGAMRFIPALHPLINATTHALGLTVVDFKPGMGLDEDTLMYIRGKHFKRTDAIKNGPYNLQPNEEVADDFHLRWSVFFNGTDYKTDKDDYNETFVLYLKTKDNMYLYQQSAKLAYTKIGLSSEAYSMFRDTFGFYSYYDDIAASMIIPARNPDRSSPFLAVKTVKEGMGQIPQKLIEEFISSSTRHRLTNNHRLQKITKGKEGVFHLEFQKTITLNDITSDSDLGKSMVSVCANNIVMALPKMALKQIEYDRLKQTHVTEILENASKDAPAAKVFLAYDRPWWRNINLQTRHTLSDLPNRQTYDFGTSRDSNKSILLAVYTDMEDVKFWRELQFLGKEYRKCTVSGSNCVSEKAVTYAQRFLAKIYNISVEDIPDPIDGAVALWDNYPYGAAWHVWRPGYIWENVQATLMQPALKEDIFISSGLFTFGEGDSWSESALSSAEKVLRKF